MMMSGGMSVSNTFAGAKVNNMKFSDFTSAGNMGIITGVKVMWHNYIVGLELVFSGKSAGVVKGGLNNNIWEEIFNLNQGDYITGVYGRSTNVITCLGFKTAKGMTKTWGNPLEGNAFTFELAGQYIKALKVGVSDYLNYLEPVFEEEAFVTATRIPFSTNGKFTNSLGKMKSNSEQFDDWDWLSNKFNYQVAEVKLWHDGKTVMGIQFSYLLDGTKKSPGKHCAEVNGLKCESLVLEENEHITKILIRAGDRIDSVSVYTDLGRSIRAGGQGGAAYLAVAPESHHFVSVGGAIGNHLDTLQIFFDEIY